MDQAEKVITPTAASTVGGAIIGSHHAFGIGLLPGAGLGAALGLGAVLLKRGDEINLPQGTNVEMVLQAPFSLEQITDGGKRALRSSIASSERYAAASEGRSHEAQETSAARHSEQSIHSRSLFPVIRRSSSSKKARSARAFVVF